MPQIGPAQYQPDRAAYLWNPYEFGHDTTATQRLDRIVRTWNIRTVWLAPQVDFSPGTEIRNSAQILAVLKTLKQAGVKTGLLAGESEWGEPQEAEPAARLLWTTARWNRAHPTARWDEVHLDIEPHARPDFPLRRTQSTERWWKSLGLLADVGDYLGVPISLSIPTTATLGLADQTLAVPPQLAGRFRSLALMAYRRPFEGPQGSRVLVEPALQHLPRQDGPVTRIWLGMELTTATPMRISVGLSPVPPRYPERIPAYLERGIPVRYFEGEGVALLGYGLGPDTRDPGPEALKGLWDKAGFSPLQKPGLEAAARQLLRDSGEAYDVVGPAPNTHDNTKIVLLSFRSRMPANVSYYGTSGENLVTTVRKIEEQFRGYDSFAGVCFHDLTALDQLTSHSVGIMGE